MENKENCIFQTKGIANLNVIKSPRKRNDLQFQTQRFLITEPKQMFLS